jgi:hypothetical protein
MKTPRELAEGLKVGFDPRIGDPLRVDYLVLKLEAYIPGSDRRAPGYLKERSYV